MKGSTPGTRLAVPPSIAVLHPDDLPDDARGSYPQNIGIAQASEY